MTSWTEAGTATLAAASTTTQYDAIGNIRKVGASFNALDAYGNSTGSTPVEYWYRYDALNRVVTDKGTLSGGVITRGANGSDMSYDGAGQRVSRTVGSVQESYGFDARGQITSVTSSGVLKSELTYDLLGRLRTQSDYGCPFRKPHFSESR